MSPSLEPAPNENETVPLLGAGASQISSKMLQLQVTVAASPPLRSRPSTPAITCTKQLQFSLKVTAPDGVMEALTEATSSAASWAGGAPYTMEFGNVPPCPPVAGFGAITMSTEPPETPRPTLKVGKTGVPPSSRPAPRTHTPDS